MALLRVLALAALSTLVAPPAHASSDVLPIAAAREAPLGAEVTVSGVATTPSGAFASSFFDEGFGVQDATGGLYVSLPADLSVVPGRRVRVTGVLRDSHGLLVLAPAAASDVVLGRPGPRVPPERVPTSSVGESTEGRLVRVLGGVVGEPVEDLPYGRKFEVDDGSGAVQVFVALDTGIDISGLHPGARVAVTGFSGQFDTHHEVLPRSPRDVRLLGR